MALNKVDICGVNTSRLPILSDEDKEVYAKWNEAKAAKDFETADKYRAVLMEKGIL